MPMATKIKNSATEIVPFLGPSNAPANMTPMFANDWNRDEPERNSGKHPQNNDDGSHQRNLRNILCFHKNQLSHSYFWNSVYYELC